MSKSPSPQNFWTVFGPLREEVGLVRNAVATGASKLRPIVTYYQAGSYQRQG